MGGEKTINIEQTTALIDYLQDHKELALGYLNRSKEGRSESKRMWNQCADILNSVSAHCCTKSGDEWRAYYNDYKSKLLKKIRQNESERSGTGGGPSKTVALTELQERLHILLGKDVGQPLPGVRHNPIPTQNVATELTVHPSTPGPSHNNYNYMFDVDLQYELENNNEVHVILPHHVEEPQAAEREIENDRQYELNGPESPRQNPQQNHEETEREQPRENERRRRRRRSPRRQPTQQNDDRNERGDHMLTAANKLEQLEKLNADALMVTAQAISRLAAAIESVARKMPDPENMHPTSRRDPYSPPSRTASRRDPVFAPSRTTSRRDPDSPPSRTTKRRGTNLTAYSSSMSSSRPSNVVIKRRKLYTGSDSSDSD